MHEQQQNKTPHQFQLNPNSFKWSEDSAIAEKCAIFKVRRDGIHMHTHTDVHQWHPFRANRENQQRFFNM